MDCISHDITDSNTSVHVI